MRDRKNQILKIGDKVKNKKGVKTSERPTARKFKLLLTTALV